VGPGGQERAVLSGEKTPNGFAKTVGHGRRSAQFLLFLSLIGLVTATQLAFKAGSEDVGDGELSLAWLGTSLIQPSVWLAIALYILTFAVWLLILQRTDLSRAFPLTSLTYVSVPLLAWLIFGETVSLSRAAGIAMIVAGVALLGSER
jgi:drug/metabolite transporter (DMT)-like permease